MKIDQETLGHISALEISGKSVRIAQQLPRPVYEKVNKVLVACGGAWNRGAKAHLFAQDAEGILEAVMLTGEVRTSREDDWFPTPPALADRIAEEAQIDHGHVILEPSCGEGALVMGVVRCKVRCEVVCVEKDRGRCDKTIAALHGRDTGGLVDFSVSCWDFLGPEVKVLEKMHRFDRVVMNPPFSKGQEVEHIERAFSMLRPGGRLVSVASAGVLFRQDARYRRLRALVESADGTMEPLPPSSFKASGTAVNTVLLVMDKA